MHTWTDPGRPRILLSVFHLVDPSLEWKHVYNTIIRRTGLALGVALLASSLVSVPASATGLFGNSDATYDGVYRQSLVIAGLRAHRVSVPKQAITWLNAQQCTDGGFEPFRADTTKACAPGNAESYSGEDTNATSAAVIAFASLGDKARAKRAIAFLRGTQNADGGFPYYKGGASDVNSTAMVMLALRAAGINPGSLHVTELTAVDFLITATAACESADAQRGGLAYMPGRPNLVSDMATVQALAALAGRTPWTTPKASKAPVGARLVPALACPGSLSDSLPRLRDIVAGYTAKRLATNGGVIPDPWSGGTDLGSTAWAVIGLAAAGRGLDQASAADRALRASVKQFAFDAQGTPNAGRLGLLLLLTASRHESAKSFGGVDLVASALGSMSDR